MLKRKKRNNKKKGFKFHRSHVSGNRRWIKSKLVRRAIEVSAETLAKKLKREVIAMNSMKKLSVLLLAMGLAWLVGCTHLNGPCPSGSWPLSIDNRIVECRSQDDPLLEEYLCGTCETEINYHKSNKYYPVDRVKYPEFYRKLDVNNDGKISLNELSKWQPTIKLITAKECQEGDIDCIVKKFMRGR